MPTPQEYIAELKGLQFSAQVSTKQEAREAHAKLMDIENQLLLLRKRLLEDVKAPKRKAAQVDSAISFAATVLAPLAGTTPSRLRRSVPHVKHPSALQEAEYARVKLVVDQMLVSIDSNKRSLRQFVQRAASREAIPKLAGTKPCSQCGAPVQLAIGVCAYCGHALY